MLPSEVEALVRETARSKYWKEADAQVIVAAWADSGLPMAAFSRRFGFSVKRLARWRGRLAEAMPAADGRGGGLTTSAPRFHRVHVVDPVGPAFDGPAPGGIELALRGGRTLRLSGAFDEARVARLVAALESLPC